MAAAAGLGPAGAAAHRPDPHALLTALPSNMPAFPLPHLTSSYTGPLGSYHSEAALREEFLYPDAAAVKHSRVFSAEPLQDEAEMCS